MSYDNLTTRLVAESARCTACGDAATDEAPLLETRIGGTSGAMLVRLCPNCAARLAVKLIAYAKEM